MGISAAGPVVTGQHLPIRREQVRLLGVPP
jgi:hypothetical protein